jgi:hypothetical protein
VKEYSVELYKTRLFSGTIDPTALEATINIKAADGWRLHRTIHERKRSLFFFSREVHVLIFERDAIELPDVVLLRQLLRAYGHEPEA